MQPAVPEISTCPTCGGLLEKTPDGGLGCMICLLRAGIGSEEEAHDSTHEAFQGDSHFGVYEIDRHEDGSLYELGRGAMGVTYRATDTALQRKVALKIIKTDVAKRSVEARERFMREARAAAALRHENITTIHQFGIREETGQYFYAMELLEGQTLEERVRRAGPLDAPTTIHIAQQITAALAAAEERGLVHRDLKPANLMLVSTGRKKANRKNEKPMVKIIDFGLAKALYNEADPQSLTHDRFVGTPAFASPEQFEHSALDVRSDIYSLGETLWFALTGKTPFKGHSVEEIHRAQRSDALPIEQLRAARVPSRLKSLLESMLALEPASRPGTNELAARLQRCSPEARSARRARVVLAAAVILVLSAFALSVFYPLRTQNAPLKPIPDKSIAVLPFENMSSDPDNAYFADGIQGEILTRLASVADLKVISRTSTLQYQSKPGRLAEIAKQLGVANILEGSVQKVADQVRVNVQLINAQTDSHLWADTYDRKLTDIFGVESEIAKGIAAALQAKLSGREEQVLAAKPTKNLEAYDAYLRGLSFEARASSFELMLEAARFYNQAVQLDPNFALAWARLSRMDALIYFTGLEPTPAARGEAAKSALENAQRLAPDSPDTLLASGYYQFWVLRDYASAKTTFEHVSKMLPSSSEVPMALGLIARREGNWDKSITYFEQALALDPRNQVLLMRAVWPYTELRQFPAALKLYDRVLDLTPSDPDAMAGKASIYQGAGNLQEAAKFLSGINETSSLGASYIKTIQLRLERNYNEAVRLLQARLVRFHYDSPYAKAAEQVQLALMQRVAGDTTGAKVSAEEARNTLEQLSRGQPEAAFIVVSLSQAYAAMGKKDLALSEAQRAIMLGPRAKDPVSGPSWEESLALIQTMFGENSSAISTLTRLLRTPGDSEFYSTPITPALLRLDPIWDPLRGDPAFQQLCEDKLDKSVAVLAFDNLSDDKGNEYFSDGISEELLTVLQKIPGLRVAARTSAFSFKGKKATAQEIGLKLGVDHLVEGSVRKAGDTVRIAARLTNATSGDEIWSENYTRNLKDVFAVQTELAQTIVEQLKGQLTGAANPEAKAAIQAQVQAAEKGGTKNAEAHESYLRGRFFLNRHSEKETDQARVAFERAVELDPKFALAWAGLAQTHVWICNYVAEGQKGFNEHLAAARNAVERALALEPDLPDALLARTILETNFDYNWKGAAETLHKALALAPRDPALLMWAGNLAIARSEATQALDLLRRAVALDPVNAQARVFLAHVLSALGRQEEARTEFARAIELNPSAPNSQGGLGLTYLLEGKFEEAVTAAQKDAADWARLVIVSCARWGQKRVAESDAALAELIATAGETGANQIAAVYGYRNDKDHAFQWLERARRQRDAGLQFLRADTLLSNLHDDPRWDAFLRKIGLADDQLK
jgi:TolB-like protein/Tfp pilus assembly protein PilF